MSKALDDVKAERQRQQAEENYTTQHDDTYIPGVLSLGGAAYAVNAAARLTCLAKYQRRAVNLWPWRDGFKPGRDGRRELVKAAAMIVAEIEKMDRLEERRG